MRVVWLPAALNDLERLESFLAQHAELNAGEVATLLRDASHSLEHFPERCRRVPGRPNFRELFVEARSNTYIVQFRVANDAVVIIRVWHHKESR